MSSHSDPEIRHADPSEGFDHTEPEARAIWAYCVAAIIILTLTIVALEQYFDKIWNDAVTEKVLLPPSEQLRELRQRDDWDLTHAMYLDKTKGQVRIPVAQAEDLFLKEVAQGKLFYPAKPTVPKKEEPEAPAPAAGAPAGAPAPTPAGAETKK